VRQRALIWTSRFGASFHFWSMTQCRSESATYHGEKEGRTYARALCTPHTYTHIFFFHTYWFIMSINF